MEADVGELGRAVRELPGWMRAVMVGQFVSSAGGLAWIYLTLWLVADRGLSPARAGLITAGFGLGTLVGNFTGGWFGDRYGLRRALLVAKIGGAGLAIGLPLTPGPGLLVVAVLTGLVGSAGRPMMSALMAHALPPERRRAGIALSRTASNAGFVIGPPIGALLATDHFDAIFYADGLTALVLAAVIWVRVPDEARPARGSAPRPPRLWPALRADRPLVLLLAAVLVVDTVYRLLYTLLPLALRDAGQPPLLYGSLIAINALVIVLAEAPLAVALRRRPAVAVIAAGFALVGAGWFVLGAGVGLLTALVATTVITAGEMLYKPTATAHVADRAPDGLTGRYQSLYAGASISGTMLSPAVGTAVYEWAPGLLWPLAGAAALGAALAVRGRRAGPSRDAQIEPARVPADL